MTQKLKIKVTFEAEVLIDAPPLMAVKIAKESFGCASPRWHDSDSRIKDWRADVHPRETSVTLMPASFEGAAS